MSLGKIYYLANVLDKINKLGIIFFILTTSYLMVLMIIYLFDDDRTEEKGKAIGKNIKNTGVAICLLIVVAIIAPSKEDFLFMSITKDYTPQQIRTMTKEEIKNGIDYIVEQINKIKQ